MTASAYVLWSTDESFFALPLQSFADFETFQKITAAADAPDNIRRWPFSEEIGFSEGDGCAAQETTVTTDCLTGWHRAWGRFPLTGFVLFA